MKFSCELVKSFNLGQQAVLSAIDQIQVVARSYSKAKLKLPQLEDKLMAHLGRQDDAFFDKLLAAFRNDREITKKIEFLVYDLKELKIEYLIFTEKYLKKRGGIAERNFAKDFNAFARCVVARMQIEEDYLFPLLEKLSEVR